MGNKKDSKFKILSRLLKVPMRALGKARDFYVEGMSGCAGHFDHGAAMGHPVISLPRSFSANSYASTSLESVTDSDLRRLQKSLSTSNLSNKIDLGTLQRQGSRKAETLRTVPRSQSTGIGMIDEDKPSDFSDDLMVKKNIFARSRSCAVSRNAYRRL